MTLLIDLVNEYLVIFTVRVHVVGDVVGQVEVIGFDVCWVAPVNVVIRPFASMNEADSQVAAIDVDLDRVIIDLGRRNNE